MSTQLRPLGMSVCVLSSLFLMSQADVGRAETSKVWAHLAKKYDKNRDGQLSQDEYGRGAETFARLDRNRDGVLTSDDWHVPGEYPEFKSRHIAPKKGDRAPDFELSYVRAPDKVARLSSFAGKKPVALVFGSCT